MTVVLVCGGRDYSDHSCVYETLDSIHREAPITKLVTGGARGADTLAQDWATLRNVTNTIYMADWARYPRAGGIIRNQQMLAQEHPTLVVAFPGGRGTADMVRRSRSAGVTVWQVAP